MKAIEFNQVNVRIAENQDEYETLPCYVENGPDTKVLCCFELTDEEIKELIGNQKNLALSNDIWPTYAANIFIY